MLFDLKLASEFRMKAGAMTIMVLTLKKEASIDDAAAVDAQDYH